MLRGNLDTTLNNLLYIKAVIGIETKDKEDYVGTMWEDILMANNGANKEVSMSLQAKERIGKTQGHI